MTLRSILSRIALQEDLNFLLTNRIPRQLATQFVGRVSRSENPLVRSVSMWAWRLFADLDLSDAKTTTFRSLHDCFIRELKDGARPIDMNPAVLTSPCDAIVGACGSVVGTQVFQVKGFPYGLDDLLGDAGAADAYRDGTFVTLRLTSSMYHRFHAPYDCLTEHVRYMSGDTWNVNPIALKRVERLFCRNERAAVRLRLDGTGHDVTLVAVAAILVASIRLRFLYDKLDLRDGGPRTLRCSATLRKGQEMGWFQHGSTIIVLAPGGYELCDGIRDGYRIRMGEPLLHVPD